MSKRQRQRTPRQHPVVMLLTLFAASCFFSGTLGDRSRKVCYGSTYEFPPTFRSTLGKLYFTPSSDGPRKLLLENGEVKDPRFSNSDSLSLGDVRHIDDGTYTFYFVNDVQIDRLRLSVKDCAESTEKYYMDSFRRSPVDFEYVEFSRPGMPTQEKLVWKRAGSNANSWRAHVINNIWEIRRLTPEDDGYYNFRRHDKSLVTRIKLSVQAYKETYTVEVGDDLYIAYPGVRLSESFYTVTFTRGMTQMLMKEGEWVIGDLDYPITPDFTERYLEDDDSLTIESITMTDDGTFEFRDSTGYMILTVEVTVIYVPTPGYVYIIIASIFIFLLLLCCCCVRKRCCKKGSSKGSTDAPQDAATAPAVYYHDTTQNSGPTYSTHPFSASPAVAPSSQPLNPVIGIGKAPSYIPPDTTPLSAPTYPAHAYSASPAVAPSYQPVNPVSSSEEGPSYNLPITAPVPSDCLSSDTELRFELKGMTFPSALPLSSDSTTTTSDVYTSDKLNFL